MLDRFNKVLLESVGVGLAMLKPDTRQVVFANRRFSDWFPGAVEQGQALDDIIPGVDYPRLKTALSRDRSHVCETSIRIKRRTVSLALQFTRHVHDGVTVVILECQNISKIKELELMIESYSRMVEQQNRILQREKERVDKLLLNLMPRSVYEELKTFGVTTPQKYEEASILMLDFVGFTEMAISHDPAGLISELNDIFTSFDHIAEQFGCERIKTIGDAYMAVSGIPEHTVDHAHNIAKLAILILRYLHRRNATHRQQWQCRIGISSGTVIGSIVGVQKYVYDIFGPGVNLAARMEALSQPMQITLCDEMRQLIQRDFHLTDRGEYEVKGFGRRRLYSLDGDRGVQTLQSEALA
jgi:adenylate cyclase